jgi:thiol-disulfide isomerase/thioredoxin
VLSLRTAYKIAGLAAVAGAAFGASYYLSQGGREPQGPSPVVRPVVPDVRPLFALADTAGVTRSIAEWDGRALVINFWATWCPPCRREIPLLNSLRAEYAPRGFEVIGVAVDFRDDVLRYMATTPIDYPVLIGEQDGLEAVRAFGLGTLGFPFTVFTDMRGRIITIHVGELHAAEAAIILAAVTDVVAGRVTIEAARTLIRGAARPVAEQRHK